jgi:hypothetical protein
MLTIFAVLAFVSAAVLLVTYLARQARNPVNEKTVADLPPGHARPLFEPTVDDLKALERDERQQIAAGIKAEHERARDEASQAIDARIAAFAPAANKQNAIDLIVSIAGHGDAGQFSRAASEIIRVFRAGGIDRLTAGDLAALLDSHYRLLPAEVRSSGELFWLKKEIAELAGR